MANGSATVAVPYYSGLSTDIEPEAWLKRLDLWFTTAEVRDNRGKIAQAGLLLKNAASVWFDTLEFSDSKEEYTNDWTAFCKLFATQFHRNRDDNWREVANLYNQKQSLEETCEAFATRVQNLGASIHATLDNVRFAILNGLSDDIKAVVLTHEAEDIPAIIRWGSLAERLNRSKAETKARESEIDRAVQAALSNLKISAVGSEQAVRDREDKQDKRGRSTSPRVRFVEEEQT